jgi:hypothetical protein
LPHTVRGPTPRAFRRPATTAAAVSRARHFHVDAQLQRRFEPAGASKASPPSHAATGRIRLEPVRQPAPRASTLREKVERNLLQISIGLFFVGSVGWCWLIFNEFRSTVFAAPAQAAYAANGKADAILGKSDVFGTSTYERMDHPRAPNVPDARIADTESPANIVAHEWSRLEPTRIAERARAPAKQTAKAPVLKPSVRVASLESTTPQPALDSAPSLMPSRIGGVTSLVDFETAPFPYHGMIPGLNRPFLNVKGDGRLGHANFRGHVLWESETFSDGRVLLHIPTGFDPRRPAIMVVFFHGHGADLARDVRDRQQVPAQITAAGVNAVLVAPQFAFDASDSSAGKFWEPNGFKRFLDEAAGKLATLYGDPRAAFTFARMPIVIVAYSGGFGPTLSVLDRGGVRSRVRGVVLLDALYAGIDKFADWIADNRSTFFVSSYTPHTAHHNADLERLLNERSVAYGRELRRDHLQGMVAFLPTGDISHRNFVTHAWTDGPIMDILARIEDVDPKVQTAGTASPAYTGSVSALRN